MFEFLKDIGTYEQRKVKRYEEGNTIVDTAAVSDSTKPYETGIKDPRWNNGAWVIVEEYYTKLDAQNGHNRWVKKVTGKNPPKTLRDVSSNGIAQLRDIFSEDNEDWRDKE